MFVTCHVPHSSKAPSPLKGFVPLAPSTPSIAFPPLAFIIAYYCLLIWNCHHGYNYWTYTSSLENFPFFYILMINIHNQLLPITSIKFIFLSGITLLEWVRVQLHPFPLTKNFTTSTFLLLIFLLFIYLMVEIEKNSHIKLIQKMGLMYLERWN